MVGEHEPLISQSQNTTAHFEIANETGQHHNITDSTCKLNGSSVEPNASSADLDHIQQHALGGEPISEGATAIQTSLNIAKLCMGTGTLALPFAAQKGGIVFNMIGLGVIVVWNYLCADCLLGCLDCAPRETNQQYSHAKGPIKLHGETIQTYAATVDNKTEDTQSFDSEDASSNTRLGPPDGTTTYGVVAWQAFGKPGLIVLDLLMIMLFVGLLIAYQGKTVDPHCGNHFTTCLTAIFSFVDGITQNKSYRLFDKILASLAVATLSCAKDISFLSRFSVFGLMALAISFVVIFWEGAKENGWQGFTDFQHINLWPESMSAASSWFGVVVFGYGVVPFIFNFKDSMANPNLIGLSTKIGLTIAYVGYLLASNGIRILYSQTRSFDGDVLQVLPESTISLVVRMMMTLVVAFSAPLIAVPCGELIEGKLHIDSNCLKNRIALRTLLCASCTLLALFVPGFVHIISFIGCFCVSMTSFVLPSLFSLRLTKGRHKVRDVGLLFLGLVTSIVTSVMTFRNLFDCSSIELPIRTITTDLILFRSLAVLNPYR